MISRGRRESWLRQPTSSIQFWAHLNDITFHDITCGPSPAHPSRGMGLIATRDLHGGQEGPLLVVPRTMVLTLETVWETAKWDGALKEVLEAVGYYGRVCMLA